MKNIETIQNTLQNSGDSPKMDENPLIVEFPEPSVKTHCSWAECSSGHKWRPTFMLVDCPGCGSPSLMGKMENCPICNQPTERVSLRHDHVPKGGGISKRCEGVKPYGESLDIQLERMHWKESEEKG